MSLELFVVSKALRVTRSSLLVIHHVHSTDERATIMLKTREILDALHLCKVKLTGYLSMQNDTL
jgi:hypothetical protein